MLTTDFTFREMFTLLCVKSSKVQYASRFLLFAVIALWHNYSVLYWKVSLDEYNTHDKLQLELHVWRHMHTCSQQASRYLRKTTYLCDASDWASVFWRSSIVLKETVDFCKITTLIPLPRLVHYVRLECSTWQVHTMFAIGKYCYTEHSSEAIMS